jgi:phospholipase C
LQENRSFDSYFGTYPGADGIPMANGVPTVCVPDPVHGGCQRPYQDASDVNGGGPHGQTNASADIDGGKMDGFIAQAEHAQKGCANATNPNCTNGARVDAMRYHDASEIRTRCRARATRPTSSPRRARPRRRRITAAGPRVAGLRRRS